MVIVVQGRNKTVIVVQGRNKTVIVIQGRNKAVCTFPQHFFLYLPVVSISFILSVHYCIYLVLRLPIVHPTAPEEK